MQSCNNLAQTVYMTYNVINSRILENNNYKNNKEELEYNPNDYYDQDQFNDYLQSYMPSLSLIRTLEKKSDNYLIYSYGKEYLKIIFNENKIIIKVYGTMKDVYND